MRQEEMSGIVLGLTLVGALPDVPGRPAAENTFTFSDGKVRVGLGSIDSERCDKAIDLIESHGIGIESFNFAIDPPASAWANPDEIWVGAILGGGDVVPIDPDNTFDPVFPGACRGSVPRGLPIRLMKKPKGHVVGVKSDVVFSASMSDFLAGYAAIERATVIIKGQESQDWFRLTCADRVAVLDPQALDDCFCLVCGLPRTGNNGIWLGHRLDFSVGQDACGISHLGMIHPIVISLDIAGTLVERYRGYDNDFKLSPIVDRSSDAGRRVLELLRRIRPLVVRDNWIHRPDTGDA